MAGFVSIPVLSFFKSKLKLAFPSQASRLLIYVYPYPYARDTDCDSSGTLQNVTCRCRMYVGRSDKENRQRGKLLESLGRHPTSNELETVPWVY